MEAGQARQHPKLGVLPPQHQASPMHGAAADLLPLSAIGVACSCSGSSRGSPTAADEASEDWEPSDSLTESPTAAGAHGSCYCCSTSCCCRSNSSTVDYKWWASSSSSSSRDIDDLESSTVCSSGSRPDGGVEPPASLAAQEPEPKVSSSTTTTASCSRPTASWGGKENENPNQLVKESREAPKQPRRENVAVSCSCSGSSSCAGREPALHSAAAAAAASSQQQQQGTTATASIGCAVKVPQQPVRSSPSKEKSAVAILSDAMEAPREAAARAPPTGGEAAADAAPAVAALENCGAPPKAEKPGGLSSSAGVSETQQRGLPEASSDSNASAAPAAPAADPAAGSPSPACAWPELLGALHFRGASGGAPLCYCLEHLLAGLWGPPCLCGVPLSPSLWGGGPCGADGHLVNPQHELEVLLQASPEIAHSEEEPLLCFDCIPPTAAHDPTQQTPCGVPWPPHPQSVQGVPWRPLLSYPAPAAAAATRPPYGLSWGPPRCDSVPPVSDWGSPAHQWGPPLRAGDPESPSGAPHSCSSREEAGAVLATCSKGGLDKQAAVSAQLEDSYVKDFASFLIPYYGLSSSASSCPRTSLSADSFVSSRPLWSSTLSSEDEGEGSSKDEGDDSLLLALSRRGRSCRSSNADTAEGQREACSSHAGRGGLRIRGPVSARGPQGDALHAPQGLMDCDIPSHRRHLSGSSSGFCQRVASSRQHILSPAGSPSSGTLSPSLDLWEDSHTREGRQRAGAAGGLLGAAGVGGAFSALGASRCRDTLREEARHAVCSSNAHSAVVGIAAVPVRTRKGFRKPLPLPPEMLAAIAAADSKRPVDPVLQYDGESREWRVFWMEDPQARYKVFQSKKFGKERAQQLALDWLRRAKAGVIHGSGRGPRAGGVPGFRTKRGRSEASPLATEYPKQSTPETPQSLPQARPARFDLSPERDSVDLPFPAARST